MRTVRDVSSYKFAYSYKKVVSSSPNITGLIVKIHINYLNALPQFCYAFKHLLNLTDKNLFSLRTPIVKTGQIPCCQHAINLGDM